MRPKYLIFTAPLLLFAEMYLFSWIVELLRQQSDVAVIVGVVLSCTFIFGNFILINYLIKQFNKKTK